MVPALRMLFVSVELRVVGNGNRLQSKARVVLDADDRRVGGDQLFKKPVVVAVNIDGEHPYFGESGSDQIEIFQREEGLDDLNSFRQQRPRVSHQLGVAIDQKASPGRIARQHGAVKLGRMKSEFDKA